MILAVCKIVCDARHFLYKEKKVITITFCSSSESPVHVEIGKGVNKAN